MINRRKINQKIEELKAIGFTTKNAPKYCCYYDIDSNNSVWYFGDEGCYRLLKDDENGNIIVNRKITYKKALELIQQS